jgi:serine/threonine protein kinase
MSLSTKALDPELENLLEEFAGRLKAGEALPVEEFAAAHPEHADLLRRLLPTMAVLADLGRSADRGGAPLGDGDDLAGTLGDFRIVREVGRGGMGVVYEAEQISLNRRVALKVLPFAATMDTKQLQRFKNEAQAAAQLHHTNIVPVHYVGCERGVHFYAMQYIEGHSLADVIAELRRASEPRPSEPRPSGRGEPAELTTPQAPLPNGQSSDSTKPIAAISTSHSAKDPGYFRTVAELGIQAAEALDYAHQVGVVHRDVKPANLLIDGSARLWVTDFGLAQVQSDTRLTVTGDLVGTLRYMSPEQALAKRVVVDHRTDIYSLGATLYELLTLEPVFSGTDRQELLRQIAFEEPTTPRRINKAIPVELETIVLKSLEKSPDDRYASAQEFADDLRRFLADEPIKARRPSLGQRVMKWTRRHQAVVLATAAGLLVAVAALAASTVWAFCKQHQTEEAREVANEQRQEAIDNAAKAQRNAAEATKERQRADENFRKAATVANQMLTRASPQNLPPTPEVNRIHQALAEEAMPFFQELLQKNPTDLEGRLLILLAYQGQANAHRLRSEFAKAAATQFQALRLYQQLAADYYAEPRLKNPPYIQRDFLDLLARATSLGERAGSAGQHQEAAKFFRESVDICEIVSRELGDDILMTRPADLCLPLADALWATGQSGEAEKVYGKAMIRYDMLIKRGPELVAPVLCTGLQARAQACRGLLRAEAGQLEDAEADLRGALDLIARLKPEEQKDAILMGLNDRARVRSGLGNVLWARGRRPEASLVFRQAEDEWQAGSRANVVMRNSHAWFLATCPDTQFRNPKDAVELARQVVKQVPESNPWRTLGVVHHRPGDMRRTLGVALYRAGDWNAAVEALNKGAKLRQGGDSSDWFFLAMAHWQLRKKDKARQWYDKGVAWMDKYKAKDEELSRFRQEAEELLGIKEPREQIPEPMAVGD